MGKNRTIGKSLQDLNNINFEQEEVKKMPENKNNKEQEKKLSYANTPYNFIEFPDRVVYRYDNIDELPKHNVFYDKFIDKNGKEIQYNTGYIEYEFKNDTPLFIGGGENGSHFLVNGNPVIPGATIRGFVRSNCEMLSFSYPKSVENRKFMFRNIAGVDDKLKEEYSKKLNEDGAFDISDKVKAGYIKNENGNYYLYEAREENGKTFKLIDEFRIKHFGLAGDIKYIYEGELSKLFEIDESIEKINSFLSEKWKNLIKETDEIDLLKKRKKEVGELYSKYVREIKKIKNDYEINSELKRLKNNFREITKKREELYNDLNIKFIKIGGSFKSELEKILNLDDEIKNKLINKIDFRIVKELEWRKVAEEQSKRGQNFCYETTENIRYILNKKGGIDNLGIEIVSELKGRLYNCNHITGKKKHYFIFGKNQNGSKKIFQDSLIKEYDKELESKTFDNSTKNPERRKQNNNEIRSFYSLPKKNGEEKVIFYKLDEDGNVKYFGRNPYLRMFYDSSTKDILEKNIKIEKEKIDFTESIFGFINKNKQSYKSRISFEDIKIIKTEKTEEEVELTLSSPKATSFQLYLTQDKKGLANQSTYNNPDAKLRGHKFYWLRENGIPDKSNSSDGVRTKIKPIQAGAKFTGKIHFENLTDDELGLLLLSLKYDESTKDSIGMAKPYGYGKIEIKDIELVIEKKKESFENFFNEKFDNSKSIEDYKKDFKNKFLEIYGNGKEVDTSKYEKMKIIDQYKMSKKNYKGKEELRYMGIKEFSDRKPLKDINDYVKENQNE